MFTVTEFWWCIIGQARLKHNFLDNLCIQKYSVSWLSWKLEFINNTVRALQILPYPIDRNQWCPFNESKKDLYFSGLFLFALNSIWNLVNNFVNVNKIFIYSNEVTYIFITFLTWKCLLFDLFLICVVMWGRTADPEFEYPKSRAYLQKR